MCSFDRTITKAQCVFVSDQACNILMKVTPSLFQGTVIKIGKDSNGVSGDID